MHVLKFNEFINEQKLNEMFRGRRRTYRGGYGDPNGSSDYYSILPRDRMRARELTNRRSNSNPNLTDEQIAVSNAHKMAKLITKPGKLIARMEAVYNEWGPGPILQPFIDRIIALEPEHQKYVAAWRVGQADGAVAADPNAATQADDDSVAHIMAELGMLPPEQGFEGNSAEKIIYQVTYDKAMKEAGVTA